MRLTRILLVMAAADLIFFGGWVGDEVLARSEASVRLPVAGFDPRDLLSGHYVRIRLVAEREARQRSAIESDFCIEGEPEGLWHVTGVRAPHDGCTFIRRDQSMHGGASFGVERFYVDERLANEVDTVREGQETYLVATISSDGRIHPQQLVVNGRLIHSGN